MPFVSYSNGLCTGIIIGNVLYFFLDATMTSEQRKCDKCRRKMDKDELFYHSRDDDWLNYCTTCFDKQVSKRCFPVSKDDFQLMVYCLPPGIRIGIYTKALNIISTSDINDYIF